MANRFKQFDYDKPRLEAFSDAVFAIIMTLLVLEIKVPHTGEMHTMEEAFLTLWNMRIEFVAWLISFMMVAVGWVQHHHTLHMSRKVDLAIVWINMLVLMGFCLVPFTSAFMSRNPSNPAVITVFGIELAITAFFLTYHYWYIATNYLKPTYDKKSVLKHVRFSFIAAPLLYVVASLSAWVAPWLAYVFFIIIPLLFIFPLDVEKTTDKALPEYADIE